MKTAAFLLLFVIHTTSAWSQYTSATIAGYSLGENVTFLNPANSQLETRFSGLMYGRLSDSIDGPDVSYYFLDVRLPHNFNLPRSDYFDDIVSGGINPHACWIIKNFYPGNIGAGQLNDLKKECASVQLAIWHFAEGLQLQTVQDTLLRSRAVAIANLASTNGSTVLKTVEFIPDLDPEAFFVKTIGDDGNPIAIDSIELFYDSGLLSTYNVSTSLPGGLSERIEVIFGATGFIKAYSDKFVFPRSSIFRNESEDFPRIFLATPGYGERYFEFDWGTLPVELSSFTAMANDNDVLLNWSTSFEINNSHFVVQRSFSSTEWTDIATVEGHGTTGTSSNYTYTDIDLPSGQYEYRLKQVDFSGNSEFFELDRAINIASASDFSLDQNYPNPFNPFTKIEYVLAESGHVEINVYDLSGKKIAGLVDKVQQAGRHELIFDSQSYGLATGVYIYSIETHSFKDAKTMMLIK